MKKKWKTITLITIGFICIPLLLNHLLLLPSIAPQEALIGTPKDWLSFWSAYLGAGGTFLMAFITYRTIKQNDVLVNQNNKLINQNEKQLSELKRQWEEEHRAKLNCSIIKYRKALGIRIKNIGKNKATDIQITFNNDFIESIPIEKHKEMFRNVERKTFCIEEGEAKYILIGSCNIIQQKWENKDIVLRITGSYCSKYHIEETFYMKELMTSGFMEVKDALGEIADSISCPNSLHLPIQQSLDIIAKKLKN